MLTVFFATHDPTTKDRQGNDVGSEYRSIVLCDNTDQMKVVQKFIEEINASNEKGDRVVTEVKILDTSNSLSAGKFYPAESYHKDFYENNKNQMYCQVVINPKLAKVQGKFAELLK